MPFLLCPLECAIPQATQNTDFTNLTEMCVEQINFISLLTLQLASVVLDLLRDKRHNYAYLKDAPTLKVNITWIKRMGFPRPSGGTLYCVHNAKDKSQMIITNFC